MNHLYLATSALLCAVQVVNGVIYNGEKLGFCRSDDSDESCSISIRGTGEGSLRQFEMVDGSAALFGAGADHNNTMIQSNTTVFFSATGDALALNPDPSQIGLVKTGKYDPSTFDFVKNKPVVTSNVKGCSAITSAGVVATATRSSSSDVFTQMYIVENGAAADNYTADGDNAQFGGKWVNLTRTWKVGSSTPTECTAQCAEKALPFASFKIRGYGALLGTSNGKFLMPDGTTKTVGPGAIADMFTSMYFKGGSAFSVRGDIEVVPGEPKCFKTKQGTCEDRISIAPNEVKMLVAVPKWTWTEIINTDGAAVTADYACATTDYDISLDGIRMPSTDAKLKFFTVTGDEYVESVGPLTAVSEIRWVTKDTDTEVKLQVRHMINTTEATLHNFVRYEGQNSEGTQAPADVRFTLHTCASRSDYSGGEPGNVYIDPSVFVLDIGGPNDSNRVTASALTSVVLLAFLSF